MGLCEELGGVNVSEINVDVFQYVDCLTYEFSPYAQKYILSFVFPMPTVTSAVWIRTGWAYLETSCARLWSDPGFVVWADICRTELFLDLYFSGLPL